MSDASTATALSGVLLVRIVVALLAIVPVGAFAQTEKDVDRAEAQLDQARNNTSEAYARWRQAQDDLEAALLELDQVTTQLDNLIYTIGLLESKITSYESDVDRLKETAQQLVLEAYTSGGRGLVSAAFEAGSIQDLLTSQQLMDSAANRDIADLDRSRLLLFGGCASASRDAGVTMQMVGERLCGVLQIPGMGCSIKWREPAAAG